MAVKGTQNSGSYSKKVGYSEFKVVKFNPNREELNEILGIEEGKTDEIDYVNIDSDGNQKVSISVWLEDIKSHSKFNLRFTIVDKVVVGKNSGKTQFINSVGDTGWGFEESDLQNWFTNFVSNGKIIGDKSYRECLIGEGNFYKFLRAWFNINYFEADAELNFDSSKWFDGNMNELNGYIGTDITQSVVALATIRVVEKKDDDGVLTGEIDEYQSMYNGAFLPGRLMKLLRIGNKENKQIKKFVEEVTGEYGCNDYYVMQEIRDYNSGENLAASNDTKAVSNDDPGY